MTLKTATLLAIIGLVTGYIFWQLMSFNMLPFLAFPEHADSQAIAQIGIRRGVAGLIVSLLQQGTMLLFLIMLYLKQK
ncbi:MAG: hypothetical protein WCS31_03185 [Verrucomicrobiae bacterium]